MPEWWIIADPVTGTVVRKQHEPAGLKEGHLVNLQTTKAIWKSYRAGDVVSAFDFEEDTRERWVNRRRLEMP